MGSAARRREGWKDPERLWKEKRRVQKYESWVNEKGGILFLKRTDILTSVSICISTTLLSATFGRPLKAVEGMEDHQGLILICHRCSQLIVEFKAPSASTFFVVVQGRLLFCFL